MDKKRISVIVPVYNCKRYIQRCLNSLINQTYPELEIIIVDDGSTDGSGEICDTYAMEYKNIHVIHQANGGPGAARNTGLNNMTGDFFTFVDGDDYVSFHCLETMQEVMEEQSADVVEVGMVYLLPQFTRFDKCIKPVLVIEGSHGLLQDYYSGNSLLRNVACGRLYCNNKLGNVRFREHSIGEDYEYSRAVLENCDRLVKIDKCLYAYRCYQTSLTRTKFNHKNFDVVEINYQDILDGDEMEGIVIPWENKIKGFEDTCYELMKKMADARLERTYTNELERMLQAYQNVKKIARKKNVATDSELEQAMIHFETWAVEYRKGRKCKKIIMLCKRAVYLVMSKIKCAIMYEYKFER